MAALAAVLVCAPARSVQVDLGLVDQVFTVAMGLVGAGPAVPAPAAAGAGPAAPEVARGAEPSELDDDLTPATARVEAGWQLIKALTLAAANAAAVQPHVDMVLSAMRSLFASKKVRVLCALHTAFLWPGRASAPLTPPPPGCPDRALQDAPAKSDAELRHQTRTREAALSCLQTMLTADGDLIVGNAERAKKAASYCTVAIAALGTLPASVTKLAPEFGLRRVRDGATVEGAVAGAVEGAVAGAVEGGGEGAVEGAGVDEGTGRIGRGTTCAYAVIPRVPHRPRSCSYLRATLVSSSRFLECVCLLGAVAVGRVRGECGRRGARGGGGAREPDGDARRGRRGHHLGDAGPLQPPRRIRGGLDARH